MLKQIIIHNHFVPLNYKNPKKDFYFNYVILLDHFTGPIENKLDLIYILRVSNEEKFTITKELLINLTRNFVVGPTFTRIGFVSCQDQMNFTFNLNAFLSTEKIAALIDQTSFLKPNSTWLEDALNFILRSGFTKKYGARNFSRAIARAVVVITDQAANLSILSQKEAVLIYVLGVGENITLAQLRKMASSNSNAVFSKDMNIEELNEFKEKVSGDLRKGTFIVAYSISN